MIIHMVSVSSIGIFGVFVSLHSWIRGAFVAVSLGGPAIVPFVVFVDYILTMYLLFRKRGR